jgi:rubrerythrin
MTRRLKPAGAAHAQRALEMIVADELRHDDWLAAASDETRIPAIPVTEPSRRFFSSLESHDLVVHLSRIATLDGCVCQILSRVLAADGGSDVPAPIAAALIRIRRDEAGHVRTARALARELGLDSAASRAIELETRRAFSGVIARHESAFTMLGVDAADLARRLQRHET